MLPDFLLIGATKCGTTSVYRYLDAHPQTFIHPTKELRYFTEEHDFGRGAAWYEEQFDRIPEARSPAVSRRGEASNAYTRAPVYAGVPERIAALLPDVRLVYVTRDPMERIESHYRHRLVTGIEWRSADEAVRADPRYLAASLYGQQVAAYRRVFPAEQILVLRAETLFADPAPTLDRLCRFLGVSERGETGFEAANVTAARPVAPLPLRHLTRIPRLKDPVKSVIRRWQGTPLSARAPMASEPHFGLSEEVRATLRAKFAEDGALLATLTQQEEFTT